MTYDASSIEVLEGLVSKQADHARAQGRAVPCARAVGQCDVVLALQHETAIQDVALEVLQRALTEGTLPTGLLHRWSED